MKDNRLPNFTVRFSPSERRQIEALKDNLRADFGKLTTAGVIRAAVASMCQFRGVQIEGDAI